MLWMFGVVSINDENLKGLDPIADTILGLGLVRGKQALDLDLDCIAA